MTNANRSARITGSQGPRTQLSPDNKKLVAPLGDPRDERAVNTHMLATL